MGKILEELQGRFWTVFDEMLDEIRDCGYSIDEANDEYVICHNQKEMAYILLGTAGRSTKYIFRIDIFED